MPNFLQECIVGWEQRYPGYPPGLAFPCFCQPHFIIFDEKNTRAIEWDNAVQAIKNRI